jgi:hypothetical protein
MRLVHRLMIAAALGALALLPGAADAGWYVGVRVGGPYPYYYWRPYPYYYPYYYAPTVVVAPAVVPGAALPGTVIAQSPPQQGTGAALTTQDPGPQGNPPILPPPRPLDLAGRDPQGDALLGQLRAGDDRTRADAANQLGRNQSQRAVDPLMAALISDHSAQVRDASARALGMIGNPIALDALQRAAQADDDREVRASARFAADVIRDRQKSR